MEGLGGVCCDCRRWMEWRDWEVSGVIVTGGWGGGTGRCLV